MGKFVTERLMSSVTFWICLSASILLMVAGFLVPPTGVIDGSVLTGAGELFAFATLSVVADAIHEGYDAKVTHGNTTIEVTNDDGHEEKVVISDEEA